MFKRTVQIWVLLEEEVIYKIMFGLLIRKENIKEAPYFR
jgi:hypothetical protein